MFTVLIDDNWWISRRDLDMNHVISVLHQSLTAMSWTGIVRSEMVLESNTIISFL